MRTLATSAVYANVHSVRVAASGANTTARRAPDRPCRGTTTTTRANRRAEQEDTPEDTPEAAAGTMTTTRAHRPVAVVVVVDTRRTIHAHHRLRTDAPRTIPGVRHLAAP